MISSLSAGNSHPFPSKGQDQTFDPVPSGGMGTAKNLVPSPVPSSPVPANSRPCGHSAVNLQAQADVFMGIVSVSVHTLV